MESIKSKCRHCGKEDLRQNLYRVDDKLIKNSIRFRTFFKCESKDLKNFPKFCRICRKKWINLGFQRGKNIKAFLKQMRSEMFNQEDTSISDSESEEDADRKSNVIKNTPECSNSLMSNFDISKVNEKFKEYTDVTSAHVDKMDNNSKYGNTSSDCDEMKGTKIEEQDVTSASSENEEIKDSNHWLMLIRDLCVSDLVGEKLKEKADHYFKKLKEAKEKEQSVNKNDLDENKSNDIE